MSSRPIQEHANATSKGLPMKRLILAWLLLVATVMFNSVAIAADPAIDEATIQRLRDQTAGDTVGIAVLVARDGKIVYQGGFGLANLENKTPITPDTKFRIGSVSKQFT